MPTTDDYYNSGAFDRLLSRMSRIPGKALRINNPDVRRLHYHSDVDITQVDSASWSAWTAVVKAAIAARNAALKLGKDPAKLPGVGTAPTLPDSDDSTPARVEYHVIVEYRDPTTGGAARFPVVVDSTTGLNPQQLENRAAALGLNADSWKKSGERGDIAPATAEFVSVTIVGIIER
jgi:hypothetical protein